MSFAHQSGAGGVTVHGLLSGLDADDHPWAARTDKARPSPWVATGDLAARSLTDLGTRLHSDLTNLAYADAAHTGFCSLATAQTVTAQKLIDSTIGLRFGHAAGPLLQGPAAGDLLSLTGGLRASGSLAARNAPYDATKWLNLSPANPGQPTFAGVDVQPTALGNVTDIRGFNFQPQGAILGAAAVAYGMFGAATPSIASGVTVSAIHGLNFTAFVAGGGGGTVIPELHAIHVITGQSGYTGTITAMRGLYVRQPFIFGAGAAITASVGLDVANVGPSATIATAIGLRIADINNAVTRYLIEAGPATPNLRLLPNAPPNAGLATEGDSQLFFAWMENGAVNLRRVRWRQQSSLLATDKVLIAA